jgi:hypothetical protein
MRMDAQLSASSYKKSEQFRRSKPDQAESELKHEFVQTIGDEMFVELEKIADEKGIRVQTLLRAVVIPEWVQGKSLPIDPRSSPSSPQMSPREKRRENRPQKF